MDQIQFDVWFTEMWLKSGGLISQATAAKILNRTQGRISQMVNEKKLKLYQYENMLFVSFIEVREIAQQDNLKKAKKMLKEASALLPDEIGLAFENDNLDILNFATNPPEIIPKKTE